ncbi:Ankyrin repeat and BTB/POZ domain-containing protein 1 [Balamuthia mandrillaris]
MSGSDSDSPPPLVPDDGEGFHDDLLTRPILRRSRSKSTTTSSVVDEDLFLACRAGKLDSVRYMVEVVGLPVNQRDRWDSTPLYYACLAGHKDVVLYLLEQGARCEENTFDGERCFHGALTNEIRNILRKHKAVVRKHDPFSLFMRSCYLPTRSATASLSDSSSSVMQSSLSSSSSSAFQTSSIRATNPFLKYSDIIFVVGNPENEEKLRCHRVILAARCEYFKNMLLTRWKDKPKVFLRHARMNATAFKAVLQFLYTERLEIDRTLVTDCALLCRKCGLHELCAALERENEHDSKYHVERLVVEAIDLEQRKHEGDSIPIHQITTPLQHDLGKVSQRALFGKLQDDDGDDYADVIFSVNDRRQFRCHKLFFCGRCEYFATLLMGSFREVSSQQEEDEDVTQLSLLLSSSTSSEDEIEEVKVEGFSEEAFAMIVDFIYTDKLSYSFPPPSSSRSSSSSSSSSLLHFLFQNKNGIIICCWK